MTPMRGPETLLQQSRGDTVRGPVTGQTERSNMLGHGKYMLLFEHNLHIRTSSAHARWLLHPAHACRFVLVHQNAAREVMAPTPLQTKCRAGMVESKRLDVLLGRRVHTGQGALARISAITELQACQYLDWLCSCRRTPPLLGADHCLQTTT